MTAPEPPPPEIGWDGWPADLVELFVSERAEMVRLAHLISGSNALAEEIVQDAFVRLRDRWGRLDKPGGYLRTTVVNAARQHLRRLDVEHRYAHLMPQDHVVTGDPEIDETWDAVCRLPERQRAVLALRFYEDLPEAEIAEILGCRVGTVKSNLHRALRKLRREL
jgi:RNA polymerase sigma-70 factor (sigma-E family)